MKVTYLVNSMILIEGKNTKVLCDPWVTFDRYSASGLYNFPEIKVTKEEIAAIKPDFIYLTHTHEDHFDPITIGLFDKDTPVLVANYANNFTQRSVQALGFTDVRVCNFEDGLPLNGDDRAWIEPSAIYDDVDSIGAFKIDGEILVNANDCPFSEEQCTKIKDKFGTIDFACVPFATQGPYPAFYENLSPEEKKEKSDAKKQRGYREMLGFTKTLAPERVFPFAAGAMYGAAKALNFEYYGVGTQKDAAEVLEAEGYGDQIILMSNMCSYDTSTEEMSGEYEHKTHLTEQEYIQDISTKSNKFDEGGKFWIAPDQRKDLTKLLAKARKNQKVWQDRKNVVSDKAFFIDVGQGYLYRLSLGDLEVTTMQEEDITDKVYEIFRMPYPLLIGLLTAHYNYSNVKTQYMSFYREPDDFDPDIHILMSFLQL